MWAIAIFPPAYSNTNGCALRSSEPPGGRVADVADRGRTRQLREDLAVEGLRDKAHRHLLAQLAVGKRDQAGRLLPAMLQRVEPQVRDVGGFVVMMDAKDAAHAQGLTTSR